VFTLHTTIFDWFSPRSLGSVNRDSQGRKPFLRIGGPRTSRYREIVYLKFAKPINTIPISSSVFSHSRRGNIVLLVPVNRQRQTWKQSTKCKHPVLKRTVINLRPNKLPLSLHSRHLDVDTLQI
jgi:hypothetical protein